MDVFDNDDTWQALLRAYLSDYEGDAVNEYMALEAHLDTQDLSRAQKVQIMDEALKMRQAIVLQNWHNSNYEGDASLPGYPEGARYMQRRRGRPAQTQTQQRDRSRSPHLTRAQLRRILHDNIEITRAAEQEIVEAQARDENETVVIEDEAEDEVEDDDDDGSIVGHIDPDDLQDMHDEIVQEGDFDIDNVNIEIPHVEMSNYEMLMNYGVTDSDLPPNAQILFDTRFLKKSHEYLYESFGATAHLMRNDLEHYLLNYSIDRAATSKILSALASKRHNMAKRFERTCRNSISMFDPTQTNLQADVTWNNLVSEYTILSGNDQTNLKEHLRLYTDIHPNLYVSILDAVNDQKRQFYYSKRPKRIFDFALFENLDQEVSLDDINIEPIDQVEDSFLQDNDLIIRMYEMHEFEPRVIRYLIENSNDMQSKFTGLIKLVQARSTRPYFENMKSRFRIYFVARMMIQATHVMDNIEHFSYSDFDNIFTTVASSNPYIGLTFVDKIRHNLTAVLENEQFQRRLGRPTI